MANLHNTYGQPIGESLPDWVPCPCPKAEALTGRYCKLVAIDPAVHGDHFFKAFNSVTDDRDWTYLPIGSFNSPEAWQAQVQRMSESRDPLHFAIIDKSSNHAVGSIALMRIDPNNGVVEVGYVIYSSQLKRSRVATEAQYLLMHYVFEQLGYRRYEWKCDALNAPSRAAAKRLGFQFEGIFRQAMVYRGRTRDTAWYSMIDSEWPAMEKAFVAWLDPANFDEQGQQKIALSTLSSAENVL